MLLRHYLTTATVKIPAAFELLSVFRASVNGAVLRTLRGELQRGKVDSSHLRTSDVERKRCGFRAPTAEHLTLRHDVFLCSGRSSIDRATTIIPHLSSPLHLLKILEMSHA